MKIFLISVTSLMIVLLAMRQLTADKRIIHPDGMKMKAILCLDVVVLFNLICCILGGVALPSELSAVMMTGMTALYLISLSFVPLGRVLKSVVTVLAGVEFLLGISHVLQVVEVLPEIPIICHVWLKVAVAGLAVGVYVFGLYMRLRNIKSVMRAGSVWNNVMLTVDSIYLLFIIMMAMSDCILTICAGKSLTLWIFLFTCAYASLFIALSVRIRNSSVFVLMTEQERRIVESMKISHVESVHDMTGSDMMYKNLYDKILEYFVESKPYLNNSLTINDVVAVVLSNKLYISRAINQYTGRNFCQFVNYYRVVHAIELFRNNTELKVGELANLSGFNSAVSFGMAFKLYMGEKPGDWCRREKFRKEKLKN